jgi:hypothetical protein
MATNTVDSTHQLLSQTQKKEKPPRGMLSFVVRESLHLSAYDEGTNARLISATGGISKRARRRHRREASRSAASTDDEPSLASNALSLASFCSENNSISFTNNVALLPPPQYDHKHSEFTFFLFLCTLLPSFVTICSEISTFCAF